MTNLNNISGMNEYCGPAVLAAITGLSTDECASAISRVTGKKEIKAVDMPSLVKTLKNLRCNVEQLEPLFSGNTTLFRVLTDIHSSPGFYIIGLPKHVIAIEVSSEGKIYFIDNHTKESIPANSSARMMQRVDSIYKIVKKNPPKFIKNRIEIDNRSPNKIYIYSCNFYEDEKDNCKVQLGSFKYTDIREFNEIVYELNKLTLKRED